MVKRYLAAVAVLGLSAGCDDPQYVPPPAFMLPIVGSELANPLTDTAPAWGAVFDDGGDRLVTYDTSQGVTETVAIDWPEDFTLVDLTARTRSDGIVDTVVLGYARGQLQTLIAWFDPQVGRGERLSATEVTRVAGWAPLRGAVEDLLIVAGAEFVGTQHGGLAVPAPHWEPLGVYVRAATVEVYGLVDTQPVAYSIDLSTYVLTGPAAVTWAVPGLSWRTRSDILYLDSALHISADWFVLDATVPAVPEAQTVRPVWRGSDSQLVLRSGTASSPAASALELGQSVVAAQPAGRQGAVSPVWVSLADGAVVRLLPQSGEYVVSKANRRAAATTVPQFEDRAPFSNPALSVEILGAGDGRYFLPSQSVTVSYEEPLVAFVPASGFAAGVSIAAGWSRILRVGDTLRRGSDNYAVTAVTHSGVWLDRAWPGGKPTAMVASGRYAVYGSLSGLWGTLAAGESMDLGGIRLQIAEGTDPVNAGDRFTLAYETQLRAFRGAGALSLAGWDLAGDRVWTLNRAGGSLACWQPSDGDSCWVVE